MRPNFRKFMKMLNFVTSETVKLTWGAALRAIFKYMVCRDGWFPFLEQYYFPPVTKLQKSECNSFVEILDILGHSSESNRWICLRVVQDGAKILKNVLPEA